MTKFEATSLPLRGGVSSPFVVETGISRVSSRRGQRASANPTEALIPDNLLDYRDPYDGRSQIEIGVLAHESAKAIRRVEDCCDSYEFAELEANGIMMISRRLANDVR
jgi:hypothetical protein